MHDVVVRVEDHWDGRAPADLKNLFGRVDVLVILERDARAHSLGQQPNLLDEAFAPTSLSPVNLDERPRAPRKAEHIHDARVRFENLDTVGDGLRRVGAEHDELGWMEHKPDA